MLRLLSFIFLFLLVRPVDAKTGDAAYVSGEKEHLSSFASLSFRHESLQPQSDLKSYKSVLLKKKKQRNRGTKLNGVRLPLNPLVLSFVPRKSSFFFYRELFFTFFSATPPHRGPPSHI